MTKQRQVQRSKRQSQTLAKQRKQRQQAVEKELRHYRIVRYLLGSCFLLSCLLFLIFFRAHRVDGHSMAPTLLNNDRVFTRKNQRPKRYSLITFEPPNQPGESYVKRIIGLPGDRIWVDNNSVYLTHSSTEKEEVVKSNQFLSGEALPDGTIKVWVTETVAKSLYALKIIPEGHYFVMGDNQNHSNDSRHFGLIEDKQIEGVVVFRYYPFHCMGNIY